MSRKVEALILRTFFTLVLTLSLLFSVSARAEFEWISVTVDNDLFLGNDSGYTNGIYVSLYDVEEQGAQPSPSWMLTPLLWSLPPQQADGAVNSYTIGQTMVTPEDITIKVPSEQDLPYAGLLFVNNTYLSINKKFADKISTTLGVVGPLSLAEPSQKIVHKVIGSDEPQGWNTQLENELVFQFDRGRAWRAWVSQNQNWDLVTTGELSMGTISSSVDAALIIRFGTQLIESYAIPLLNSQRTTNPIAIGGDWNIYAGLSAGYKFNQIFTNGNTFRDSRSIDFKHEYVGLTLGFSYSWEECSLAFALNDSNIISDDSEEQLKDLTQYGTITFAVKF